jgi:hypothetical protein
MPPGILNFITMLRSWLLLHRLHLQNSHSLALAWSLVVTTYNDAMASSEYTSEQARQGEDVRLVGHKPHRINETGRSSRQSKLTSR